jgi:hypothetical protein
MSVKIFQHIKDALGNLDPQEIRRHTERPMRLFLYANHDESYGQMEEFFIPPQLSDGKRAQSQRIVRRASEGYLPSQSHDLEIYFEDSPQSLLSPTRQVFAFCPDDPQRTLWRCTSILFEKKFPSAS